MVSRAELGTNHREKERTYVKKGGKLHIVGYSNPLALLCGRKGVGAISRRGWPANVTDWEAMDDCVLSLQL